MRLIVSPLHVVIGPLGLLALSPFLIIYWSLLFMWGLLVIGWVLMRLVGVGYWRLTAWSLRRTVLKQTPRRKTRP
ncbi:MAG: hypothetical protein ACRDRO_21485 [Pseudonocardiaceae bacterium]